MIQAAWIMIHKYLIQECVLESQDLDDGGFSSEYQARLTEDYEGEKERTNHEENINKRHDYLKIRLDKANAVRTKYFINIDLLYIDDK